MNLIGKTLLLLAVVGFGFSVHAITPDNRYETIIDRNIFRLNEPPQLTNSPTAPELDKNVELSGISNDAGEKKAWFVVKAAKPGPKDLPQYMSLAEGQKQEFLEVVSIFEDEGEVKILNSGNSMVLSLKNNSLKPMPVAPTVPVPAVPTATIPKPQPIVPTAAPSYAEGATATVTGGPPSPTAANPTAENGGLRSIPTRTLRLAPVAATEKPIDPLTQRVLMEVQQQQAVQGGQKLPPIPPLPQ
jgi:hypothetical protein